VFVDGGFSRGTDIIKGIALDADLVLVGRCSQPNCRRRLEATGMRGEGADLSPGPPSPSTTHQDGGAAISLP
jgi:hypothetical protein